ncbi:transcriptional regulator, DeoR family [Paenibacillus sp. UNC496MF]|uniref:DeoR/GlpR family DNA-binding transcription regulator n=1 Tax=Paenibacillus sp. UNC496MF TaxID=1502753 RepID=UPI0008F36704|nr:DeoR/GlpR family DNA-binding transcription regulator [Paenibacillus sp. UNC496MF]SFJ68431.1 transcriptional regulator, DeoR family [Paenibacillus sp. UNC496MF]
MSLIGEERKRQILELLNDAGKVHTSDLVNRLGVSSESVRRYLEELEDENRLKRVYGGAVKLTLAHEELSHTKREVLRAEEKRRIGRVAAGLVQDHDVIVIDDGSTCLQMIPFLVYKEHLTIVTNSISGLNLLLDYRNKDMFGGDVIFVGGKMDSRHFRISGTIAEKFMNDIFVNKAFISIDGMMPEQGITSYDADRAILARKFMANSKQSIVLADSTKLDNGTMYKISDLAGIDTIICEAPHPESWADAIASSGIAWLTAE